MSISYVHLLLLFTGALLFIVIQFWLRKPWQSRSMSLQNLINEENIVESELYNEYLVPLLVYEEAYPIFGSILGTVLIEFPLSRFLENNDFKEALCYLRNSVYERSDSKEIAEAMCLIVNSFLRDPDVEYHCRPHLKRLIQEFLREVDH